MIGKLPSRSEAGLAVIIGHRCALECPQITGVVAEKRREFSHSKNRMRGSHPTYIVTTLNPEP